MKEECSIPIPRIVHRVGYAHVPYQKLGKLYSPEKAMISGTIFPELDLKIDEYERGLYNGS
ncbi:MAG: spore coat associated protein CotJA [Ruminiclostridium sp.]|nr:spore coat associated protein CotJA [Ruminiclostridium sp.]